MKRHDDPFFEQVRQELYSLEAVPPSGAYAGIQNKMGAQSFMRFGWYHMNVYYAALLVTGTIAVALVLGNDQPQAAGMLAESGEVIQPSINRQANAESTKVTTTLELEETQVDDQQPMKTVVLASSVEKSGEQLNETNGAESNTIADGGEVELEKIAEEPKESVCPKDHSHLDGSSKTPETIAKAETGDGMETITARQLPTDWLHRATQPDLSRLVQDLQSNEETIFLTLPVKVSVEKED